MIAAASENNTIGRDNNLVWKLPADMAYFRDKTMGHHVLMGRKNFESIPVRFKPLPGRTNIVVSRGEGQGNSAQLHFVKSIAEGIEIARKAGETELFIIGGAMIYDQCMDLADRIYLTRVHADFEGDAFFPVIGQDWVEHSGLFRKADDRNAWDMTFHEYRKRN